MNAMCVFRLWVVVGVAVTALSGCLAHYEAVTVPDNCLRLNLGPSVRAVAISGDGNVIIGEMVLVERHFFREYFPATVTILRWTKAGGVRTIGVIHLSNYFWEPLINIQISTDGLVVMGNLVDTDGTLHPFRWTEAGGMQDLGKRVGDRSTRVVCLSSDGSVWVGEDDLVVRADPKVYPGPQYSLWTQRHGFQESRHSSPSWEFSHDDCRCFR